MTTTPNTTPDSLRSCPPVARRARVERKTKESDIVVELDLDGTGRISIDTGVPFFDHMLTALGTHASFDLTVSARGDVEIEGHHTIDDTAIVLGTALGQALGDKNGIRRFGDSYIPMDETLAHAVRESLVDPLGWTDDASDFRMLKVIRMPRAYPLVEAHRVDDVTRAPRWLMSLEGIELARGGTVMTAIAAGEAAVAGVAARAA